MADTAIAITAGTGTNIDTRTEGTNSNHRQVVVLGDPATNAGVAPVDVTAGLKVNLGADNDVVLGAGTALAGKVSIDQVTANANEVVLKASSAAIGKLTANTGVDIGDVDVLSLPALSAGTNNIGDVDVLTIPVAGVDTNWFQATITSADASSATQVKVKTADKKIHIISLVISTDTAMSIQLQSDNGTPQVVMEQIYLAANGGMALTFPERFPLVVNTNEDLDVIASASGNISVTITGYIK